MKLYNSRFVNFELPPGVYEVILVNSTLTESVKATIVTNDISMKTSLSTNNFSRFDEKSFFILPDLAPIWDYMPNQLYFSQKSLSVTPIDIFHLKCNCIIDSKFNVITEPILFSFISNTSLLDIKSFMILKQYFIRK